MGGKTENGQILIELLVVVGILFAAFYLLFELSQTAIAEQNPVRFAQTQGRRLR